MLFFWSGLVFGLVCLVWSGLAWNGLLWDGLIGSDLGWSAWTCLGQPVACLPGLVWSGPVRLFRCCLIWSGLAWPGLEQSSQIWSGIVSPGLV